MAKDQAQKDVEQAGFLTRSSSEQAEENEHVARTPQSAAPASSAGALTGHTTERSVAVDEDTGKVQAYHQTTVVTDPESPLAVQVPDPEAYPQANATQANPLGVHAEPTPEEVFAKGEDSVVRGDESGGTDESEKDES